MYGHSSVAPRRCAPTDLLLRSKSLIKNPDFSLGTYRIRAIIAQGGANMLSHQPSHIPLSIAPSMSEKGRGER